MKIATNQILKSLTLVLSLLMLSPAMRAADKTTYQAQPGSKVSIEGTSTLHDWTMEGQIIGGKMLVDADVSLDPSQESIPALAEKNDKVSATVIIPVRSLKSGKNTMDEVMQQAMNEDKHKMISYALKSLVLDKDAARKAGDPLQCMATGDLTINGVTKEVTFPVTITSPGDSKLKMSGKYPLKMTTFDVTPPAPSLALGLIKTGDDVTISFDWVVKKR